MPLCFVQSDTNYYFEIYMHIFVKIDKYNNK